jgi:hypothetical protein
VVIGVLPSAPRSRSASTPSGDYLTEKAAAQGNELPRIAAFVRDEVPSDPTYQGIVRGAVGTLWAGTGSDDDSKFDAIEATQSLVFRYLRAGRDANFFSRQPIFRTRELFAGGHRSAAGDARNRDPTIVTTGWVPESTKAQESPAAGGIGNQDDATAHRIAYDFLAASDDNTRTLLALSKSTGSFTAPRVTIISTEAAADGGASVSLDLRLNSLELQGGDPSTAGDVSWARSLYDASIESVVLEHEVGRQATSAADVLADLGAGTRLEPDPRVAELAATLSRLVQEPAGAAITSGPSGLTRFGACSGRRFEPDGLRVMEIGRQPSARPEPTLPQGRVASAVRRRARSRVPSYLNDDGTYGEHPARSRVTIAADDVEQRD